MLLKALATGGDLRWESHSHYPCHSEKSLLSVRGFEKCVSRPVPYSYHSCGPAKSKASSGANRRGKLLDWSMCRPQLEQAAWWGSSAHSSAERTHTYTQVSSAAHRAGPVGQNDPSYPNMSHHIKIFLTQWLPKQSSSLWCSQVLSIIKICSATCFLFLLLAFDNVYMHTGKQ